MKTAQKGGFHVNKSALRFIVLTIIINNMSASLHGNKFKELVASTLKNLERSRIITDLNENIHIGDQFFAPFVFKTKDIDCVLFCTTSARTDRLKIHQWDAWGINKILNKKVKCFIVLPNNLSEKELFFAEKEIKRIENPEYISMINSIIFLADLAEFLRNYKSIK